MDNTITIFSRIIYNHFLQHSRKICFRYNCRQIYFEVRYVEILSISLIFFKLSKLETLN